MFDQIKENEVRISMSSIEMDTAKCHIPISNSDKVFTVSCHSEPDNDLRTFTVVEFATGEFGVVIVGDVFFKVINYICRLLCNSPRSDLMEYEDHCATWGVTIVPHLCHVMGGVKRTYKGKYKSE